MPTAARDPFDVLGLPASFDLTADQIQRAYLTRARRLHPDVANGAESDASSQIHTAELNRAASALRDSESRAAALLNRLGGPTKAQDQSLPAGFLQSILETRMEIEEARGDEAARARWEAWAREQRAAYAQQCGSMFRALSSPPAESGRREIRQTLNAWRYIERLIEQLDPAYDPAKADFDSQPRA